MFGGTGVASAVGVVLGEPGGSGEGVKTVGEWVNIGFGWVERRLARVRSRWPMAVAAVLT